MTTSVSVDFNARARDGLVKASLRRADAPLAVGQMVLAVDDAEDMRFQAYVDEIDVASGHVYLRVLWEASPEVSEAFPGGGVLTSRTGAVVSPFALHVIEDAMTKAREPVAS